jgi:hypothetical protein
MIVIKHHSQIEEPSFSDIEFDPNFGCFDYYPAG